MANEKFEPGDIITDTEVRLECLSQPQHKEV